MHGIWNERLGWLLLLVGFITAVGLDPWSLSERDPATLRDSARMAARHAQAVVLAMGFLQLAVAKLLREDSLSARLRRFAGPILVVGTLVYAVGYVRLALSPGLAWLIPLGAAANLFGFALLSWAAWRVPVAAEVCVVLAIFLFGMAIDVASGLFAVDPSHFLPAYLGPQDGVRQRMLRLGRVAATALSLATLLFRDLCPAGPASPLVRWSRIAVMTGTLGMPTVLTAACFINVDLKYLLAIPSLAMTSGVLIALVWARRRAAPLEQWGWLLIASSMNVGLLIGMYAFDGPLSAPEFIGGYNEFVRRLSRLGHAYCIVLGLLAILLARQSAGRLATVLLLAGTVVTEVGIVLLPFWPDATAILAPGPALVALSLLDGVRWSAFPVESRDTFSGTVPEKVEAPLFRQRSDS